MNPQNNTTNKAKTPASGKSARRDNESQAKADANRGKEISFELDASAAKEVLLAGDFTGWEKTPIRLRKGDRGTWQTSVTLAPGQYHYRFVVDGQWRDDPRARKTQPNPFGTRNCILEIP